MTANIDQRHSIDQRNLSGEFYLNSILQEAAACEMLSVSEIEKIQLECIKLLAFQCEKFNDGQSSSIRVEAAENIMSSNLYTIGLYLKSLPNPGCAVEELKTAAIPEMYQKGKVLINLKLRTARRLYRLTRKNKVNTLNHTYNATLEENGIGNFFKLYNRDYEAHETPALIDYSLCNPVADLAGVEFIEKYLKNLYLENKFCANFAAKNIHYLLSGYDAGYRDLLINVFEQVLTAALGSLLVNRSGILELDISKEEAQYLQRRLLEDAGSSLPLMIREAAEEVIEELKITSAALRRYIEKSLPKITSNIACAVQTRTLEKVLISPVNLDLKPKIVFSSGVKMKDEDYRHLIGELLLCRYSSDKLVLIKENVKSFDDFEDLLMDAQLSEEEIVSVFGILGDVEIAALIKRHPFISDIETMEISQAEQMLQLQLKNYLKRLSSDRQDQISEITRCLIDENEFG